MGLKACRECGAQVSTEANVCPHCGVRDPTSAATLQAQKGCLGVFAVAVLLAVAGAVFGSSDGPKNSACTSDWTKCADNAELVNHYSKWSSVQVDCQQAANEQARYGTPDWPWLSFGRFYKGDNYIKSGIAVAIEQDAKFQNGFGAMVHVTVYCTYDLRNQRVTSVNITQR